MIAAHSDDEALGCAGTMAKHVAAGDEVHVVFMTDGVGSRNTVENKSGERRKSAELVAKILGVSSMVNFDFPDNKMDSIPLFDIVQVIAEVIEKIQPCVVYTHHVGDLNIDHQITHKAVMTACRPQPGFCVKEIYAFEVLSSTEWQTCDVHPFLPNKFVDVSEYMKVKEKALYTYSDEMRAAPHSRSVENIVRLNQFRGNCVGYQYAEAFSVIRIVV